MLDTDLGPGSFDWLGTLYRPILNRETTGGEMSIVDTVSPPNSGPPRHVHHDADETFVLLSGECEFWLEGESFHKEPGETVFVPRGREHTFRVVGHQPSRHLIIFTPGGFEDFFVEMSRAGWCIPEDMEKIVLAGKNHHLEFTGPPMDRE